jgi:hypothetical protein
MGQMLPLAFGGGYGDIQILSAGYYEVIVSLEQNYVKVGKVGELEHGYAKGDVNHDCMIGIADVTAIMDILLGYTEQGCQICADVNNDGMVGIADATNLVDMVLGVE